MQAVVSAWVSSDILICELSFCTTVFCGSSSLAHVRLAGRPAAMTISKRVRWQEETNQSMWTNLHFGELLFFRVMTRSEVIYAGEHARP